ncbi:hypothetical protein GCM10011400_34980 [Paraburkholderia caffeinilytica]|uniref:Uncharacterized protein n=1 Tax=Paraburkholderia caffeinilytica TaxID=1761016 RepID=A0ABQ1MXJ7_9BURK|nr:hypothetical protein GCM10011400_34980 [Paraburkholderia caffeinilytica]
MRGDIVGTASPALEDVWATTAAVTTAVDFTGVADNGALAIEGTLIADAGSRIAHVASNQAKAMLPPTKIAAPHTRSEREERAPVLRVSRSI